MTNPLFNCIRNAQEAELITLEQRQKYEHRLKELIRLVTTTREAKEKLMLELAGEALEKERRALKNEEVRKEAVSAISKYRNKYGQQDMAEGLVRYIGRFEGQQKEVKAMLVANLGEVFHEFRKGALTGDLKRMGGKLSDEGVMTTMANVRREMSGEKTNDAMAAKMAASITSTVDLARQMFNDAGGNIPKMKNYDLEHQHNAAKVLKKGQQPWVDFIYPLVKDKMVGFDGKPMSEPDLKAVLGDIWKTISTDGMIDVDPSMVPTGKGALYKQHSERRVLQFNNADAWMTYAKEFGNIDLYSVLMSHVDMMSKDITAMKFLGTNPPAMMNYLNQLIEKHVKSSGMFDKLREGQFAKLSELSKQRNEVIAKILQKENPTNWETEGAEALARMGTHIDGLHAKMQSIVGEIGLLRQTGDLRRNQADMDKMAMLTQELDAVQREINSAKNDPTYDAKNPLPLGAIMELNQIGNEYQRLLDEVRLDAIELDYKVKTATEAKLKLAMDMWGTYIGSSHRVYDPRIANIFNNVRNANVFSKLGSALVSAMADFATNKATRQFLDMPNSSFVKMVGELGGEVGKLKRDEAVRMHILLEDQVRTLRETAGNTAAYDSTLITSHLADTSLRASFLPQFTEVEKRAWAKSFYADMGDQASKSYMQLSEAKRRMLQRNDISPAEWEQMRQSPSKPHPDSAPFLLPSDVQRTAGEKAAIKYGGMMYNERQYAIIEPTLEVRTRLTLGTKRGTIEGELVGSAVQFKSFGVTMLLQHGRRMMEEFAREGMAGFAGGNLMRYAANLFIFGTLLGAVIIQLKDMIVGRDPRPMDNVNFWAQAALQGGGFGIWGDFLQSSGNRAGQGMLATALGPTFGQIENVSNLTVGNFKDAWNGKNTHVGSDLTKIIQSNTPFASLWYTRKLMEATFFDELEKRLNPHAYEAFRRRIDKRAKDYNNQKFWWAPGENAPSRAPDLGAVVGR